VLALEAIVVERLYARNRGQRSREICAIGQSTQVCARHLSLAHIFPNLHKTPWGNGPTFGSAFVAHLS